MIKDTPKPKVRITIWCGVTNRLLGIFTLQSFEDWLRRKELLLSQPLFSPRRGCMTNSTSPLLNRSKLQCTTTSGLTLKGELISKPPSVTKNGRYEFTENPQTSVV